MDLSVKALNKSGLRMNSLEVEAVVEAAHQQSNEEDIEIIGADSIHLACESILYGVSVWESASK